MAIFGNFKGTTQSEFQIGKSSEGSKISTGTRPSSGISTGDLYVDSSNSTLQVYNNAWVSVGSTLTDLNVDSGTLFVDSSNDTVSVGSTSSNDKLFVNGSLRLGTNPSLKFAGAYLDVSHANGTATQLRIRDNGSGSDPIFKVYNASNSAEVFKVEGNEVLYSDNVKAKFGTGGDLEIHHNGNNSFITDVGTGSLYIRSGTTYFQNAGGTKTSIQTNSGGAQTFYHNNSAKLATSSTGISVTGTINVNSEYSFPSADGSANQILVTDGSGTLSFASNNPTPAGSNTQIQFNDAGSLGGASNLTYTSSTDTLSVTNLDVNGSLSLLEDYGSIASTATVVRDYGLVETDTREPVAHDSYTVTEANNLTGLNSGDMIFVSNETGGATMAFYDGSDWRRVQDRAVIS
jgi:hypothetical protein